VVLSCEAFAAVVLPKQVDLYNFQLPKDALVGINIPIRERWQELAKQFLTFQLIILLPYYRHEYVCAIRVCICVWIFRFSE